MLCSGRSLRRAQRRREVAGLRAGEAAARSAFPRPEFKIQDSKLNRLTGPAWADIPIRAAACGARKFGNELRASAAPRLRRPFGRKFRIQNSRFKITKFGLQPAEVTLEADLRDASCGPPPPPGCGPPMPAASILLAATALRASFLGKIANKFTFCP